LNENIVARNLTDEGRTREILIIHDDLNAGGGSERIAATTIETLGEIGFNVDLATFRMPDMIRIQRQFGIDLNNRIRKLLFTSLCSVLDMEEKFFDADSYDIVILQKT
jgi:hypothetical protein